jgi:hypothetical protein
MDPEAVGAVDCSLHFMGAHDGEHVLKYVRAPQRFSMGTPVNIFSVVGSDTRYNGCDGMETMVPVINVFARQSAAVTPETFSSIQWRVIVKSEE